MAKVQFEVKCARRALESATVAAPRAGSFCLLVSLVCAEEVFVCF